MNEAKASLVETQEWSRAVEEAKSEAGEWKVEIGMIPDGLIEGT